MQPGLRKATSRAFVQMLLADVPNWVDDANQTVVDQIRAYFSPKLPTFPQIAVRTLLPHYRPRFAGGVMSVPPVAGTPGQDNPQPLVRGGQIQDTVLTVTIRALDQDQAEQLADVIFSSVWAGIVPAGCTWATPGMTWLEALDQNGITMTGNLPDQFEVEYQDGTLAGPQIQRLTVGFLCVTRFAAVLTPSTYGTGATFTVTLVGPDGQLPATGPATF